MTKKPIKTARSNSSLEKLARSLFVDQVSQQEFVAKFTNPKALDQALVWLSDYHVSPDFPWQATFVQRVASGSSPGKAPEHDAGRYYIMDLSSAFAAGVMLHIPVRPKLIIDLCSSPGGKAVFAWRVFKPELLVCNEVIGKRIPALISNVKRCGLDPAIVTSHDSQPLAERLGRCAQLVLVDAPCSGQSLVVKGEGELGSFHPATVNMNSNRQRRIIANGSKLVSPGGFLIYMTCTFSKEENEKIIEWFLKRFKEFKAIELTGYSGYQSTYTQVPCYRLFPGQDGGAGAFVAVLHKDETGELSPIDLNAINVYWQSFDIRSGLGHILR